VTVGDFNGDGKADLAVAIADMPTRIDILLGKGNGNFLAPIELPAGTEPKSVETADLNHDGKLDLVVANDNDHTVVIYLGKGDGNFTIAKTISVDRDPASVAIGDLNGDGKPDIVVANTTDDDIQVMLGKGTGNFLSPVEYDAGDSPASVSLADLNGDGKLDVIETNEGDGPSDPGNVLVYLGSGDGTLLDPFTYLTNNQSPVAAAFGDFNHDGKLDMAIANFNSDDVSVLLNATTSVPASAG
jgi:hypothetical protein